MPILKMGLFGRLKTAGRLIAAVLAFASIAAPLSAQYYYFGKNKIAYRPLAWQILKTPSCDIYFDASLSNVAPEAARIAEEACARLSRLYRIHLTSTIPIVIYGSSAEFANNNISDEILDEGTGGFTEFQKDRVVIPFNGRFEDFRHVLVHELGHAFQLNSLSVGNDLSGPTRPPGLWIMEGLAEYGSLGYDSTAELYARDGILTGALPSLMELDNVYGLGYRYYYVYKGGQAFFSYLAEIYGEEKVSLFYQKAIRQNDIDKAFKESLGKGMEDVSRDWFFYLKKKHFPSVGNRVDPDLKDRRLTAAGKDYSSFNLRPAFGVSNRTLYYISNKRVYAQILEYDLVDDRVVRTVSSADRDAAFESINILNNTLSLNSNRTTLLFSSRSGDTHFFNLYDLQTRRFRERIPMRGFTGVFESALSPEGGRILFSGTRSGQNDLYLWDIAGKKLTQVTDDAATETDPAWSPDGKKIAYAGNKLFSKFSFKRNLFIRDLVSGEESLVTAEAGVTRSPQWSPDGSKLAYVSDAKGSGNLYVKDLKQHSNYQMTSLAGEIVSLTWSPEGDKIAYTAFSAGFHDIFVKDIQLSNTNYFVAVAPDDMEIKKEARAAMSFADSLLYRSFYNMEHSAFSYYRPTLYPDSFFALFGASSGGGLAGRLQMSFNDMLNDHRLYLDTYLSYGFISQLLDTDTTVEYVNVKYRVNYGFSLNFFQQNYITEDPSNPTNLNPSNGFSELRFGASAFGRYPISKYARFDLSFSPIFFMRTYRGTVGNDIKTNYPAYTKGSMAFRGSFTVDNTLFGYLHPVDNSRGIFLVEAAPPLGPSSLSYLRALADVRQYFLLGRKQSIALRLMSGAVAGQDKKDFEFRIGGQGFDFLYSITTENFPTLRSYPIYAFRGSYMGLFNLEYRVTLLDQARFSFPFPFSIGNVNAVFFFDAGSATSDLAGYKLWDFDGGRLILRDLKASFGVGLRFVLLIFPMKLDFSTPWTGYSIKELKDWDVFLSIGFDF